MANDTLVRHDEPAIGYGGFTKEQHNKIRWRVIHHPVYDPEPTPKKASWFGAILAWALAFLTAP